MKKLLFLFAALLFIINANAQTHKLIIGTFTRANNSEGIYIYDFDTKTAETKQLGIIKNSPLLQADILQQFEQRIAQLKQAKYAVLIWVAKDLDFPHAELTIQNIIGT